MSPCTLTIQSTTPCCIRISLLLSFVLQHTQDSLKRKDLAKLNIQFAVHAARPENQSLRVLSDWFS